MLLFKALCYSKTPPRNEGAAAKKHEIRLRTGGWVSGSGFGPRNLHSRIIVVFFEAPEVTMTRVIPMATAGLPDKSVETGGLLVTDTTRHCRLRRGLKVLAMHVVWPLRCRA